MSAWILVDIALVFGFVIDYTEGFQLCVVSRFSFRVPGLTRSTFQKNRSVKQINRRSN